MDYFHPLKLAIAKSMKWLAVGPMYVANRFELGDRWRAYNDWIRDRGDLMHRLDYPLTAASTIWDVGGYEGQWTSDMEARFGCKIEVFEPVTSAAKFLEHRFAANPRVCVHAYALGDVDRCMNLCLSADASSLVPSACRGELLSVDVRDVVRVWRDLNATWIDVMKVNIEGAEYALIERLIASGLIAKIGELQVQFHDFVPDAVRRRQAIVSALEQTHKCTWCYEFVWENWKLIDNNKA